MTIHRAILVLVFVRAVLCPAVAGAEATTCIAAYEKAQEEKAKTRLSAALVQLRVCVDTECPKFIRDDCSRWMDQVETAMPSVVFSVRRDGQDQTEVEVRCDGTLLRRSLDGKAVSVDPGLRSFSISIPGFAPVERQLLIREGERNRLVDVEFRALGGAAPASSLVTDTTAKAATDDTSVSRTYLTYGLAGAGAAGLVGFGVLAIVGYRQEQDLDRSCAPFCSSSKMDSVKTKYVIADTCLGVGLVSLGVATYLYLSDRGARPKADGSATTSISFVPRASASGGVLELSRSF